MSIIIRGNKIGNGQQINNIATVNLFTGIHRIKEGIIRATLSRGINAPEQSDYSSYLATPVKGSFTLGDTQNPSRNNYINQLGETITYVPVRFHECTYQISQSKNIVSTSLQGYSGTIKEYISDSDFEISIDGQISGIYDNVTKSFINVDSYPFEYVKSLFDIFRIGSHIPVYNEILNGIFGIEYIVVMNYVLNKDTYQRNFQKFSIDCVSDRPINLILSEQDLDNNLKISDILG